MLLATAATTAAAAEVLRPLERLERRDFGYLDGPARAFRPGVRLSVPGIKQRVALPLEFCIKDNGPGVPEDLMPHLFDPFVTTKQQGSGLGLALVAKIIGDHGGIIECESQLRRTTFRVLMPIYSGDGGITDDAPSVQSP